MPMNPGRVERSAGVSGRRSPALAGSLPYNHHMMERKRDGEADEAGRMTDSLRRCPSGCWSIGGDVVAMWYRWHHPEADRVADLPSP